MRILLPAVVALIGSLHCWAANPSFKDFSTNQFVAVPGSITIIGFGNVSTNGTVIITNLFVTTEVVTNLFVTQETVNNITSVTNITQVLVAANQIGSSNSLAKFTGNPSGLTNSVVFELPDGSGVSITPTDPSITNAVLGVSNGLVIAGTDDVADLLTGWNDGAWNFIAASGASTPQNGGVFIGVSNDPANQIGAGFFMQLDDTDSTNIVNTTQWGSFGPVNNSYMQVQTVNNTNNQVILTLQPGIGSQKAVLKSDAFGNSLAFTKSDGTVQNIVQPNSGYDGSTSKALTANGTYQSFASGSVSPANPTATIGLTAVNGSAATYMRSDGAPALGSVGTAGTYGDSTHTVTVTTDAAGRVTAVTTNAIPAAPGPANPTATVSGSAVNGSASTYMRSDAAPALSTVGTAGTYGDASHTVTMTTDANGRVTAVTTNSVSAPSSTITDGAGIGAGATLTPGSGYTVSATSATPQFTRMGLGIAADANNSLEIAQGTITSQKAALELSGTWNQSGTSFIGIKGNFTNTAALGTTRLMQLNVGSTAEFDLRKDGQLTLGGGLISGGQVQVANGSTLNWASASQMTSPSDGTVRINPVGSSGTTLNVGATTLTNLNTIASSPIGAIADTPGQSLSVESGPGTGTTRGGFLRLRTPLTGTVSGTTIETLTTRFQAVPQWVNLTESSATTVLNIALAGNKYLGTRLFCTINADDGTDYQARSSEVSFDAVSKNGTVTVGTVTQTDNAAAVSSGTLTVTYTAVTNGNSVDVKANAVSSLTQTTLRCKLMVLALNSDDVGTITEQ